MSTTKKDRIVIELDTDLKREFKSQVARSGDTMKEVVIKYIKSFISENKESKQSK